MPKDDAIIQEVRAVRHQIARECGNDIRKISERADKAYDSSSHRLYAQFHPLARRSGSLV